VSIATKHVYSTRSNITGLNAFPNINRKKEFQGRKVTPEVHTKCVHSN